MPYKKGDRVQNIDSGIFGTVYQDQTDLSLVHLNWDKYPGQIECYKADAVRLAPWHETNIIDYVPLDAADQKEIALLLDIHRDPASVTPIHKIGDRVKLKYNRSCGTVKANSFPGDTTVPVEWDKAPGIKAIEKIADLVSLYAPRDTDPVNPNQAGIDAIEALRVELKKEVEALQHRLGTLTAAKKLLERG